MRDIAFVTHLASYNYFGGVEQKISIIHEHINKGDNEYKVHLFDMWKDNITDFDIVHFFNPFFMSQEAKMLMDKAMVSGTKIIVTPIFTFHHGITRIMWDSPIMSVAERLFLGFRKLFRNNEMASYFDPFYNISYLMNNADKVIVNSRLEMENILDFLHVPKELFEVIPNGINSKFKHGDKKEFADMVGIEDYILFVGRVEPIKNVVSLINAFLESSLPTKLIIVGDPDPKDPEYIKRCKKAANNDVVFLPHIPYESTLLTSAYAGAKVYALPSNYETCGMSGLEAGLAGANVVVTERGGTKEYYKDFATYVDPSSIESIKNGLIHAYNSLPSNDLKRHIEDHYSWDAIINSQLASYDSLF